MTVLLKRLAAAARVIQASAESIPYPDNEFDVSMGILTIHHWQDLARGLAEMKRVSKHKVVLLSWIDDSPHFWMQDYFPEIREIDREIFPTLKELSSCLGEIKAEIVPIPSDCTDGFMCAYWQRPMEYLKEGVRGAISTFARMKDTDKGIEKLQADIESGAWHRKYGDLMNQSSLDLGYRLVTCYKSS